MDANGERQTMIKRMLQSIGESIRYRGTFMQRVLCAMMMACLAQCCLPGGYSCCEIAMFAVLVRLGVCVPAAFAGAAIGFAVQFTQGNLIGCWQLAAAAGLWLSCGLWARRDQRRGMAAAMTLMWEIMNAATIQAA